jgi:hypothetical protein
MVEPTTDHGQRLPIPEKKTIGFVDTEAQFNAITKALNDAGYPDSKITMLHGSEGVEMLQRLRDVAFFGDWERAVADKGVRELEQGHYSFAVEVKDRDDAVRVSDIAEGYGGHTFNYFGKWVNEQLTK